MAAKIFEVGDVIPANDQVRITWTSRVDTSRFGSSGIQRIKASSDVIVQVSPTINGISTFRVNNISIISSSTSGFDTFISPYTQYGGNHAYCDIVIPIPITITDVGADMSIFTWEAMGNPISQGYNVTFEENGGSTVTGLTEQTSLPSPLPTTTKANHVFAGWYYDNLFTQKAIAGGELTTNVTLYAKWYTPTTWCEDIADAIREKDGTTEPIKHLDFPARILAIESAVEITQAQYDALTTKDSNTYYLING